MLGMPSTQDASRRAKGAVAKRPSLTAAARDALGVSGRDEETASLSRTKKRDKVGLTDYRGKAKALPAHSKQRGGQISLRLLRIFWNPPQYPLILLSGRVSRSACHPHGHMGVGVEAVQTARARTGLSTRPSTAILNWRS